MPPTTTTARATRRATLRATRRTLTTRCGGGGGGGGGGGYGKRSGRDPQSPYVTLGVESDASFAEIKLAYRKLARSTHPDVNPNSAERFRRVNAAYALLSDDNRRALFDRGNDWAVRLTREQTRTHFHTHKANASRAGPPRNTTIRWPKNAKQTPRDSTPSLPYVSSVLALFMATTRRCAMT